MKALLAGVFLVSSGQAIAASFDCTGKLKQAEQAICDDANLSAMDSALAEAYGAALEKFGADGLDALRRDQRRWVAYRDKACKLGDIENVSNRLAAVLCLGTLMTNRIDTLKTAAKTGLLPPSPDAGDSPNTYRRGADDKLELAVQPDGTAALTILAGNARGVCDVDMPGAKQGPGTFLFTDMDVGCRVTVSVKGDMAQVESSGNCSSFCGAHAPGFTGTFRRSK